MNGTRTRREHHVIATDVGALVRVARLELEFARSLGDLLEDELGIEADAVLALDGLARAAQQLDGLGQQELDSKLGDDPRQPLSSTSIASSVRIS